MVTIRPIKSTDSKELAPVIKAADLQELRAKTQVPVDVAIQESIDNSDEAFAFDHNDELVGVFGYTKRGHGAVVWMVSSEDVADIPVTVTKQAKSLINEWSARYGLLWNYVYTGNAVSIAWLEALGFTIHSTVPSYGSHNEPYHCMVKEV